MKIALLCNIKKEAEKKEVADKYAEFDSLETVNAIKKAIGLRQGVEVKVIEADELAYSKLKAYKPDFVFNIAEGLHGRNREAQMPLLLEYMQIPYSGSKPLCLSLCLDKVKTKEILLYHGISTPKFQVFSSGNEKLAKLKFPLICKLIHEGSSMGLSRKSVVHNEKELRKQIRYLIGKYKQDVLVEEFVEGSEYTIGILGNENLEFLPIVEVYLDKYPKKFIALTYEAKNIKYDDEYSGLPRNLDEKVYNRIYEVAEKAFRATGCKDFARIDIRLDRQNKPYVLELNPLPGLSPSLVNISFFPKAARLDGITHAELVNKMLDIALKRCGIKK